MKNIFLIFITLTFFSISSKSQEYNQTEINILKNLRCLVCQGQSISDSNSDFAQTIKLVVQDQINEGKSEKEIYNFLVEKYGEWIVYKPSLNKANFLLWILPYLVFLSGGVLIFLIIRKKKHN
jgi:cytochrome c-type biogenesis protein CcmH